jgi:hypothetical protein
MQVEQIKEILLQIDQLRREGRGKSSDERVRLLRRQQMLRRKICGELDGTPTGALLQEANAMYERKIGDRLTEAAGSIRGRLLWNEINRRRGEACE